MNCYQIKCACCGDGVDEDRAEFDAQMNGEVCPTCAMRFVKIHAWLRHSGIGRPFTAGDVNESNHKRFIPKFP